MSDQALPYALGCIQQPEDKRDHVKTCGVIPLPEKFELPILFSGDNQGQHNSCTGFATTYFWRYCLQTRTQREFGLSRYYQWYHSRMLGGSEGSDVGCNLRDVFKAINQFGACPLGYWPDLEESIFIEPAPQARLMAQPLRLPAYEACQDFAAIRWALAIEKQPVVAGVPVNESWFNPPWSQTGYLPKPNPDKPILGWHAICLMGYSPTHVLAMNSWGAGWGRNGTFYLPVEYFTEGDFDAWTAHKDALPNL